MNNLIYRCPAFTKVKAFGNKYTTLPINNHDSRTLLIRNQEGTISRIKDELVEISMEDNPFLFQRKEITF